MKNISTTAAKPSKKILQQKLIIGLDLGDRSSWYCMLVESGVMLQEQELGTIPAGKIASSPVESDNK